MAGKLVANNFAALTANGTSAGVVTIADTTLFPAGCYVFLKGDTAASAKYKVVKVLTATTLVVRLVPSPEKLNAPTYGNASNVSAYTVADNAKLYIEAQVYDEYAPLHLL